MAIHYLGLSSFGCAENSRLSGQIKLGAARHRRVEKRQDDAIDSPKKTMAAALLRLAAELRL